MRKVDIKLTQGLTHCHISDQGSGDWVMLVHGLVTPQFAWHFLFEALVASGYRVVSFDFYGRGKSDIPDCDYTFDLYLDQLDEIIQHFCHLEKPHLIGWSMGGALSSLYAMKHANKINKMVLISPGIVISSGHWIKQLLQHHAASTLFIKAGKQTLKTRMHQHFHAPDDFTDYYEKATKQITRNGFWPSLVSIIINYPENLLEVLHYYPDDSPEPLIIWGEDDEITDYDDSAMIVKELRGELLTIPDAAHAVHYEYPELVNNQIIIYLSDSTK